ncbi:MAG: hypothetical protein AAB604_02340 [Patescibacteria group bacterium]
MRDLHSFLKIDAVRRVISHAIRTHTVRRTALKTLPYHEIENPDDFFNFLALVCPNLSVEEDSEEESIEAEAPAQEEEEISSDDALAHTVSFDNDIVLDAPIDSEDEEDKEEEEEKKRFERRRSTWKRAKQDVKPRHQRAPQQKERAFALPEEIFQPQELLRGKGERKLLRAVLMSALEDMVKFKNTRHQHERRLYREAKEWIFSDDRFYLHSFLTICDMLGFEPVWLRRLVQERLEDITDFILTDQRHQNKRGRLK